MHLTGLPDRFAGEMGHLLGPEFPDAIGVAVSGGGDSMALLHLAAGWARIFGVSMSVVTVDHGLRDASASEAAMVADECATLGVAHDTLQWKWDGNGNLQDAARNGRRALIGAWAQGRPVLLGHTRDDQAETLLMRLARGSGVDGLAAMAGLRGAGGWQIVRPMLHLGRDELRHYLKVLNIPFVDDPTNDDATYARVRMRHLIGQEGLDTVRLANTAQAMARARVALAARAHDAATAMMRPTTQGCIALNRDALTRIEAETQLRILAGAIGAVAGAVYRPRLSALTQTLDRVLAGGTTTLQGAILVPKGAHLFIAREYQAVADHQVRAHSGDLWDGRWMPVGQGLTGAVLRALGADGLQQITVRPEDAAPRACLLGLPSIWAGDRLIACSALDFGTDAGVKDQIRGSFPQSLLVH
ncbi:tRNA(Ile)-lysidine synthase [Loktanella sp. DSM 29012]|uniref:tRNA lysidine(34) synthetase TilS n=1 Tax=Loktanella sp. DSM 29012 TaxID=1881056 RepID=UPI0008CF1E9B|nr:tRNA lysidine(34) synthetase TilS [Loktanella sp. DSM 29012]SEP78492.1 tRNA(Ile)-lysidine synthase [Loktanella sp. DSM 29012]